MIRSRNFNPWTVLERYSADNAVGKNELYMMFAGGPNFALIDAKLRISIAAYNATDNNIEDFWVEKHFENFELSEQNAQGYSKKHVATIEITNEDRNNRDYIAFKAQLIGDTENSLGCDFYWEGISVVKAGGGYVRKEAPKVEGCSCTLF